MGEADAEAGRDCEGMMREHEEDRERRMGGGGG